MLIVHCSFISEGCFCIIFVVCYCVLGILKWKYFNKVGILSELPFFNTDVCNLKDNFKLEFN